MLSKLLFGAMLVVAMPFVAMAQGEGGGAEAVAMAEINVSDTALTVSDTEAKVTFTIKNIGSVPQSDIRYGADLIKETDNGQFVYDAVVKADTVSLNPDAAVVKFVDYPLSNITPGTYSLWVSARTTGGALLGLANAGTVTVGQNQSVNFVVDSCELAISGDDAKYYPEQGVDIKSGESMDLNCFIKNSGANDVEVEANFETYRRTIFGEKEEVGTLEAQVIALKGGEEKFSTIKLPIATAPQAYDVVVTLVDKETKEKVSNSLVTHYVLAGESATIQSVNLDDDYYQAGALLGVKLFWTGGADVFDGSRGGKLEAANGPVFASVTVKSGAGEVCASVSKERLTSGEVIVSSKSKIDCVNPSAEVKLLSESGAVLDERVITVESNTSTSSSTEGTSESGNNPYMLMVLISLTVALLAILVVVARHKKVDTSSVTKLLILGAVLSSGLFGGATDAEAVTWHHNWSNSGGNWVLGVTANTNKTVYNPGETINLSSAVWNISCSNNSVGIHTLWADLGSQSVVLSDINTNHRGTVRGSGTMTAPTTPGNYNIRVSVRTKARGEVSYRDIPITVVATPPPVGTSEPATGNFDSTDAGTCSVVGWAYDPDASGNSINVHIYRDQSASAGGTYVATCAANQLRTDVNTARGISGNHGFNCQLPSSYRGTGAHNLYIHAIDVNGTPNNVIGGSPRSLSCSAIPATATISGSGCEIALGASTCQGSVTWDIEGADSPSVRNTTTNTTYSTAASGNNAPAALTYGTNVIVARDGVTTLANTSLTASCASGNWNGSICANVPAAPVVDVSLDRELVRSGSTVLMTVDVTAPYPTSCTVTGLESAAFTFSHSGSPSSVSYTYTSMPMVSAQVIEVTCAPNPAIAGVGSTTGETRVSVIPIVEEI